MVTVSLCMIVKNEEKHLPRCLKSVRGLVDELIIADTGSTDRTAAIAESYGAKVFPFEWCDDFSKARNFAFSKAGMDYILWLDADDVFEDGDRALFKTLRDTLSPDTDVVMMRYNTAFDADGQPSLVYYRERLLRRAAGFRWQGAVHETIAPAGRIVYSDCAVTHRKLGFGDPNRNLRIFEGLLKAGQALSPREQFYYARELTYHGRDREAADVFEEFLGGGLGWVENSIEACRDLAQCRLRLGQEDAAFGALTRALRFGPPRAELCCDLGQFFFDRNDFEAAAFWYEAALSARQDARLGGFVVPDCSGFIPCMQLCVCWWHLGDRERSEAYNNRAGALKPNDPAYRFNKTFFENQ